MGRGAVLRLNQPKSTVGKGFRGHRRIRKSFPLCRIRHAPHTQAGSLTMTFETDSKRTAQMDCLERQICKFWRYGFGREGVVLHQGLCRAKVIRDRADWLEEMNATEFGRVAQ
jgi:hypothetical protein